MNKKVYCYFEEVEYINKVNETSLIDLWKENWINHGFLPCVLSEKNARQNELYEQYEQKVSKFPSINAPGYNRATFLRWLAMSTIEESAFLADYDCFIYDCNINILVDKNKINLFADHVPCLVYGSPNCFLNTAREIMNYNIEKNDEHEGEAHLSDMYWIKKQISRSSNLFCVHPKKVKEYDEVDWEASPFVHYCNNKMYNKKPKHLYIPTLREN